MEIAHNHLNYCTKRKYSYYFRIRTPSEIRKKFPNFKSELVYSLRTNYEQIARNKAYSKFYKVKDLIRFVDSHVHFTQQQINNLVDLVMIETAVEKKDTRRYHCFDGISLFLLF